MNFLAPTVQGTDQTEEGEVYLAVDQGVLVKTDMDVLVSVREVIGSLFKACAESLAAENGSRLAAMQSSEKNIDDQRENLNQTIHRLRHSPIEEELFSVVSGYDSLAAKEHT